MENVPEIHRRSSSELVKNFAAFPVFYLEEIMDFHKSLCYNKQETRMQKFPSGQREAEE